MAPVADRVLVRTSVLKFMVSLHPGNKFSGMAFSSFLQFVDSNERSEQDCARHHLFRHLKQALGSAATCLLFVR